MRVVYPGTELSVRHRHARILVHHHDRQLHHAQVKLQKDQGNC